MKIFSISKAYRMNVYLALCFGMAGTIAAYFYSHPQSQILPSIVESINTFISGVGPTVWGLMAGAAAFIMLVGIDVSYRYGLAPRPIDKHLFLILVGIFPALGVMGTILGLIGAVLSDIVQVSYAELMVSIGHALKSTLYGILMFIGTFIYNNATKEFSNEKILYILNKAKSAKDPEKVYRRHGVTKDLYNYWVNEFSLNSDKNKIARIEDDLKQVKQMNEKLSSFIRKNSKKLVKEK